MTDFSNIYIKKSNKILLQKILCKYLLIMTYVNTITALSFTQLAMKIM